MLNFTFPHDLSSYMLGNLSLLRAKKLILQKWNSPAVLKVIDWHLEVSDFSCLAKVPFKLIEKRPCFRPKYWYLFLWNKSLKYNTIINSHYPQILLYSTPHQKKKKFQPHITRNFIPRYFCMLIAENQTVQSCFTMEVAHTKQAKKW